MIIDCQKVLSEWQRYIFLNKKHYPGFIKKILDFQLKLQINLKEPDRTRCHPMDDNCQCVLSTTSHLLIFHVFLQLEWCIRSKWECSGSAVE
jgi:hypothetical protein